MSTIYLATTYADQQVDLAWAVAGTFLRPFSFPVPAVGFALNDLVRLCPIPYENGILVVGYRIEIPQLDSNATPTVKLSVGDTNGASNAFQATYVNAAPVGGAAGVLSPLMCWNGTTAVAPVRGVLPKQYTAASVFSAQNFNAQSSTARPTIDFALSINTAPATATGTGIIKGELLLQRLNNTLGSF
jgi:hypothetical protein